MLSTIEAKSADKVAAASRVSPTRRAADWLLERIQRGRKEPFSEIVTLTPDIAEILLANNADNRIVKPRLIERLISDIEGGRWDLNGETVIVSKEGQLNDGQHRCTAVVQCGKAIRTAMMFGVERNSRYTVDVGDARNASDFLKMEGGINTVIGAAVARNLNLYRRGIKAWNGGDSAPTKTMIRQEYWTNEKEINAAVRATDGKFSKFIGLSTLATAFVLISRRNSLECEIFFSRLADGVGLKRGDAILALRNRIIADSGSKIIRKRMTSAHKVEMLIRYWNAWRRGANVRSSYPILGNIPDIEK